MPAQVSRGLVSFILVAALVGGLGCGEDVSATSQGRIQTFPRTQISFSLVPLGAQSRMELNITNQGAGPLTINSVTWEGSPDITLDFTQGAVSDTSLAVGDAVALEVVYAPTETASSGSGDVVILSNDPDRPVVRIHVVTTRLEARIQVSPSKVEKLNFGQVARGVGELRPVRVTNVGDLPLVVDNVILNASTEFELLLSPEVQFPYTIRDATEALEFNIRYTSANLGEDEGVIVIVSNDPNEPTYELPVLANSSAPCVRLSTELLEFAPAVAIGDVKTRAVVIESCGGVDLIIDEVAQLSGGNTEFFLNEPEPLAGLVLAPGDSTAFEILYAPLDENVDTAQFAVRTNDPLRPEVRVEVLGSGTSNQCPLAEAKGRVSSATILEDQVAAIPLDVLVVDGSGSTDAESSIGEWRWELTQRPVDSTAVLEDSGDGLARVFLDLAGDYEVCLTVVDAQGTESCNTDCVFARARPDEKLHVQLIWRTPADPVVGDTDGADVDLHFTRPPLGVWGDEGNDVTRRGWDVFYNNKRPTWPIPGGSDEHPSLDRDDLDGEGPENVNLDDPNPCSWYAVGVHYFDDKGLNESLVTLRVFVNGQRRFEKIHVPLEYGGLTGDFWYLALIHWDGSTARIFDISERIYGGTWRNQSPAIPPEYADIIAQTVPACAGL